MITDFYQVNNKTNLLHSQHKRMATVIKQQY